MTHNTFYKLRLIYLTLFVVILSFPNGHLQAKVLDIIVGGSMGEGVECKVDSDCPQSEFCHQEQYYCVPCDVPPYEWTGTSCQCPQGTVEKEGKTCVECLTDNDCMGDNRYCNTALNICATCQPPKIWQENFCLCPPGTSEVDTKCICDNPNEVLNAQGVCYCPLTQDDCPISMLNQDACACCPKTQPIWSENVCKSCVEIDNQKPLWNEDLKVCVGCPPETPFWNDQLSKCVECLTYTDCHSDEPMCNPAGLCEPCPDNMYFDGEKCVKCQYNGEVYDKERNKCVINLASTPYSRDYGGGNGRRWMVNYGFGPYEVAYKVWVEGYADDALYLDINRTLSYCNWSSDTSCKTTDKSNPWQIGDLFDFTGGYIAKEVYNPDGIATMGTLPAGSMGAVHVGSTTGWLEWRKTNAGKGPRIWLERSTGVK